MAFLFYFERFIMVANGELSNVQFIENGLVVEPNGPWGRASVQCRWGTFDREMFQSEVIRCIFIYSYFR